MKTTTVKTEQAPSIQLRKIAFGGSLKRRLLTLSTVLGLAAWGSGVAKANDLLNGNLDLTAVSSQNGITPVGWMVDASRTISGPGFMDGCSSEPWCNVQDPDGFGLFFKPFQGKLPLGDLLTVDFYQDVPTTPGTKFTLSGYAAGEANYSGFFATNSPAPETLFVIYFLDNSSTVVGSNAFDLVSAGLPSGGSASMSSFQYTTPQVTAPANTVTVRAGVSIRNVYDTTGSQSFFVDAFDLTSVPPPGSPVITGQPSQTTVSPGGTATLSVGVTGATSYQWQLNGADLSNGGGISGATSATLTITAASLSNIGRYRVRVSNGSGSLYSTAVPLALVGINFYPTVVINGKIGDTYRVDYATAVDTNTWIPFSTNKLTTSPQLVVDSSSPGSNTRFYKAVFLY